ncbi:MAG: ATPase with chaperone activity [Burkholderiales bacterium]|nr:ATPase with chaperone activity [Burkholderiales bacterium]
MSNDNQILIPQSFLDLFLNPGRTRHHAPHALIMERYELCEDLASALVEQANTRQWELGVEKEDIVGRIHQGLLSGEAGLSEAEAQWVSLRLSELMDSH